MSKQKALLTKINQAKNDVAAAEGALEQVLGELNEAPRAEKTTVSKVIDEAFAKLRAARSDLADLEKLVLANDD